jgi:hypothetical protein
VYITHSIYVYSHAHTLPAVFYFMLSKRKKKRERMRLDIGGGGGTSSGALLTSEGNSKAAYVCQRDALVRRQFQSNDHYFIANDGEPLDPDRLGETCLRDVNLFALLTRVPHSESNITGKPTRRNHGRWAR